jgi:exopolysaccharide biosynthesis polyprenyl glycosylphosphotransferase
MDEIKTGELSADELMKQLYLRYSRGGTWYARLRLRISFFIKKSLWSFVINTTYAIKRIIDIIASGILLILLVPLFTFTVIAIKIDSSGPLFFAQVRVGKWGRHFKMYKFRSMYVNAEAVKETLMNQNETTGVIFKIKKDPRITKVGTFIRKFSIDELPQLWNVFKGDMSLVGPRPPVPKEVSQYSAEHRRRLDVIPGLTCIWQVSGRSDINFEGQVKLDVQYIYSQSIFTDIKILFLTIPAVLTGRGAY